jgi:ABC-2 type transport system permease protein
MIRATFSAVPRRRIVLAAKAAVFSATALLVGTGACLAAYFVFQAFLPGQALSSSIGDPGVLRAVLGGGLYLTVLGLLGLGLGAVLRSSAGAIATLFGLLFIPTILAGILPQTWQNKVAGYLPMNSGDAIFSLHRETSGLPAWTGFAVFCGYATIAVGLGFVLITRRDA